MGGPGIVRWEWSSGGLGSSGGSGQVGGWDRQVGVVKWGAGMVRWDGRVGGEGGSGMVRWGDLGYIYI